MGKIITAVLTDPAGKMTVDLWCGGPREYSFVSADGVVRVRASSFARLLELATRRRSADTDRSPPITRIKLR